MKKPFVCLPPILVITFMLMAICRAETVTIAPEKSVIVLPAQPNATLAVAAQELSKHLKLITGMDIETIKDGGQRNGRYPFHVGFALPADPKPLAPEEARWRIAPEGAYFHGSEGAGPLLAVYAFLEEQLGVDWIEPGDAGIVYRPQSTLVLKCGDFNWIPQLMFRTLRSTAKLRKEMYTPSGDLKAFAEFVPSLERHNALATDVQQWQKRMRMGGSRPGGGHAFSTWWGKHGKTHPEYFALNKYGKREPIPLEKAEHTESFVKICPSNPKVAEQVVADWLPLKKRVQFVDTGLNDGAENFCECTVCRALDVPREGEKFPGHLTDRYVHLSNQVAREIKKHRPDAYSTFYAYLTTLYPPRRFKVESNVVVQLIPYVDPLDVNTVRDHLEGWRNAGATKLAFRPNYHHKYLTTTMPVGIEQQMFDVFQLAVKNGCVSADYDSLINNWPVTGLSDYILAKAMADPSKPFDYWAARYYAGFGNASEDVKAYFEYWRQQVWNERLKPNIVKIANSGGAGDFARGLFWSLGEYYRLSDFDATDGVLGRAAAKTLTAAERGRLAQLQLANTHARLTYKAIVARAEDKSGSANELLTFRRQQKDVLRFQWMGVFAYEISNGDLTGLMIADQMKDYLTPWLRTDLRWKFKLDPKDVGLKEKWQEMAWDQRADWLDFRTDRFWEQQFEFDEPHNLPEETARLIFTYDGIAWYATRHAVPSDWKDRRIFLRFGAVDESCWVYVNGVLAGQHIYKDRNDWKTPFEIQIDPYVKWGQSHQLITVRVGDQGGSGGIWRPVWVVSKKL